MTCRAARLFVLPCAMALGAVPVSAQSTTPGEPQSAGIEAVANIVLGVQPIQITPVADLDFGTLFIPIRASTTCSYNLHASANRIDIKVDGAVVDPSQVRQVGCGTGIDRPFARGELRYSCQPRLQTQVSLTYEGDGDLFGVGLVEKTVGSNAPAADAFQIINGLNGMQCPETGDIRVIVGGEVAITNVAQPQAGVRRLGTVTLTVRY